MEFRRNLQNDSIVGLLRKKHNIDVGSVFKLHKIMEKMGIIEKTGNGWLLTEKGRISFTGWRDKVFNPDLWHPDIVEAIAEFIKSNNIDINKINRKW